MSLITVLTAVYNAASTLPRCLDSLLSQTLHDIQVIAIDDASTDSSPDILADYAASDSRLIVLRQSINEGQAKARNAGLAHANGAFICMVDADDWLEPDALERAWEATLAHPTADCVLFRLVRTFPDGHEEPFGIDGWQEKDENENEDENVHDSEDPSILQPMIPISGPKAMRRSLRWNLHGLYIVRADIHRKYPYDDTCRLYSDDNTTRLHFLHSREVAFCTGTYYYFQNPASTTLRVSPLYFESLKAQHHMHQILVEEGIDKAIIEDYERYRWMNVVDNCYYLFVHCQAFTKEERRLAKAKIQAAWQSISNKFSSNKFGYKHCHTFQFFMAQEQLYFTLRRISGRLYKRGFFPQ